MTFHCVLWGNNQTVYACMDMGISSGDPAVQHNKLYSILAGLETNSILSTQGLLKMCLGQAEIFSRMPSGWKRFYILSFNYFKLSLSIWLTEWSTDYNRKCLLKCYYSYCHWLATKWMCKENWIQRRRWDIAIKAAQWCLKPKNLLPDFSSSAFALLGPSRWPSRSNVKQSNCTAFLNFQKLL